MPKDEWTVQEIKHLIFGVQSKPCLYDPTSEHYKDKRYMNMAWEVIANNTGRTANSCKSKWTSLRSQKRRIYNLEKTMKSKSGKTPHLKWEYNKMLYFLDPFFTTGLPSGNTKTVQDKMLDDQQTLRLSSPSSVTPSSPQSQLSSSAHLSSSAETLQSLCVTRPTQKTWLSSASSSAELPLHRIRRSSSQPKPQKNKNTEHDEIDRLLMQHLALPKEAPDQNEFFLKELGQLLQNLPELIQMETKIELQQLVLRKYKECVSEKVLE